MFDKKALGLLVALVAALFVISFVNTANAEGIAIQGKITAIDEGTNSVTLQPCGTFDKRAFNWNDRAMVMSGTEYKSPGDLKVGDEVTLRYHDAGNEVFVADSIGIIPPDMMPERC